MHVVDADTLDLALDLGFGVTLYQRFRLLGLDAPERFTDEGKVATSYMNQLVSNADGTPRPLTVRTYKASDKDKYGRYLAMVDQKDGANIVQAMIAAGHGKISRFAVTAYTPPT